MKIKMRLSPYRQQFLQELVRLIGNDSEKLCIMIEEELSTYGFDMSAGKSRNRHYLKLSVEDWQELFDIVTKTDKDVTEFFSIYEDLIYFALELSKKVKYKNIRFVSEVRESFLEGGGRL